MQRYTGLYKAVCSVNFAVHVLQRAVTRTHYAVCNMQCAVCSVPCAIWSAQCAVRNIKCTVWSVKTSECREVTLVCSCIALFMYCNWSSIRGHEFGDCVFFFIIGFTQQHKTRKLYHLWGGLKTGFVSKAVRLNWPVLPRHLGSVALGGTTRWH